MPLPKAGTVQQRYQMHLMFDSVGVRPGIRPSASVPENLLGRRSGVTVGSPWQTAKTARPGAYTDIGSGGTVTYGSATVTDSSKAWVVNEWAGRRVVAGGKSGTVLSNTATAITLVANWTGGTPSNGTEFRVDPRVVDGLGAPPQAWFVELTKHGNTHAY